jgi:GH25 family lysozyme M1 (1,4-beta-N-acetylmuramidase)
MTKSLIVDISHHQPSSKINWSQAAKEVALMVIRVQYGSKTLDREYKNHVANCKKHGIPFAHYAYGHFVSVADAKKEAKDFLSRIDKDAKFLVLDTEGDTIESCGTKDVAEASQAFIDVCKSAGYKTGFYVSHHLYKLHGLNKVKADFLWIPRYGNNDGTPNSKPDFPCELWQYTEKGRVSWYGGFLDLNKLNGDKVLDWFLGVVKKVETIVKAPSKPLTHKVIIPNTAFWQARNLVKEYEGKGFKCQGVASKIYVKNEKPADKDPYQFVLFTDFESAKQLVIELKTRGYSKTYGTKIK